MDSCLAYFWLQKALSNHHNLSLPCGQHNHTPKYKQLLVKSSVALLCTSIFDKLMLTVSPKILKSLYWLVCCTFIYKLHWKDFQNLYIWLSFSYSFGLHQALSHQVTLTYFLTYNFEISSLCILFATIRIDCF